MTTTLNRPTTTARETLDAQPVRPAGRSIHRAEPASVAANRFSPTRRTRITRAAATAVILLGVLFLGFGTYLVLLAPLQQARAQENLSKVLEGQFGLATVPVDGAIPVGDPVAVIEIGSIGLAQVVVEGTTSRVLMDGPGHRRDTPLPGQAGASVIMGRSGLFGGPFGRIGELGLGDEIEVTTGQAKSTFVVIGSRDSTQAVPAAASARPTLVLSTAAPPLAPDRSLIITAELRSELQPGRPAPAALTPAERGLQSDLSAALPLMLWGQALLLTVALITYGYLRWERWPTYVLSTPILLAVLWNVYENAAQLLPNTM